ncbi:hypothetical protein EV424DRAFT_1354062 [Suillus variegatus]|nr:hypothetical protein EV424DRAFT_1354062 [Suillus variegatus]
MFRHTEFRVPDTRTPKPETAGSRVSGVRNSELVPSSGHLIPETRQSQVSGFGCPELRTRSEFRTPDTRDLAVSGFGVRGSGVEIGFVAHQGSGVGFFHFSPGLLVNATHGRFMFLCLGV